MSPQRRKVHFASAGTNRAAWHYPGQNGACVIMAAGLGVIKEPGTDRVASRLHEVGYTILADEYITGGEPGVVVRRSPRDRVK